jgi:hypothetical protein
MPASTSHSAAHLATAVLLALLMSGCAGQPGAVGAWVPFVGGTANRPTRPMGVRGPRRHREVAGSMTPEPRPARGRDPEQGTG